MLQNGLRRKLANRTVNKYRRAKWKNHDAFHNNTILSLKIIRHRGGYTMCSKDVQCRGLCCLCLEDHYLQTLQNISEGFSTEIKNQWSAQGVGPHGDREWPRMVYLLVFQIKLQKFILTILNHVG